MDDWIAVATALNSRMKTQGISQRELSERSGVSVATLRRIQQGAPAARRSPATLAAISRVLGWPENYLRDLARGKPRDGEPTPDDLHARLHAIERSVQDLAARVERLEHPSHDSS